VYSHDIHEHLWWSGIRAVLREPFAEFFGVVIMILFGDGSVAQVLLSHLHPAAAAGGDGNGSYQSINWAYVFYKADLLFSNRCLDGASA
jgi:aquaglyceroporin related protein